MYTYILICKYIIIYANYIHHTLVNLSKTVDLAEAAFPPQAVFLILQTDLRDHGNSHCKFRLMHSVYRAPSRNNSEALPAQS